MGGALLLAVWQFYAFCSTHQVRKVDDIVASKINLL